MQTTFSNIILIGMAGAGKSTIGPVLARLSEKGFLDSDNLIEQQTGMPLQNFLNKVGVQRFQRQEEQTLLTVNVKNHVVATGGSAIYSDKGMAHLKKTGPIVLLKVPLEILIQRVNNPNSRGLITPDGGNFNDLFTSRLPLYEQWADICVNAATGSPTKISLSILQFLKNH